MKILKRFRSLAGAVVLILTAAVSAVPATVGAQSSSSLSITPRLNYVIQPGKSISDTVVIRNLDSTDPLDLTLRVVDFTYTDTSGTPKLFLAENAPQTTWSLKPFMTVPETVTVPAGQTKMVPVQIAIPANQGAGSYYSAIIYSSGSGQGGNVGLSASGVTLAFVDIPGKVNEDLQVKQLGAYDTSPKTTGFEFIATNEPYNIGYNLQNNGNVTESPVGSIKVHYMFGGDRDIENINPSGSLALIGQSRTFTTCIKLADQNVSFDGSTTRTATCQDPGLWPGMYTVSLDAFYGQNGNDTQEVTRTAVFWYLPIWFIIALVVVLLIVAFFIWRLTVRIRRWSNRKQSK